MSGKSVPEPNYTQTPNVFFDEVLPEIDSLAELKVTLAVFRQTFGWHKQEDKLSLSRLEELTGLHRETVSEGIKKAMVRGYIGRRKVGNSYVYGLRVAGRNIRPPDDTASQDIRPSSSRNPRPTKESKKESVEANASSEPQSVGLEKHIVDEIYKAMREARLRLPNEHFAYHLGRAKDVLLKDDITDEEIEALPDAFVSLWTIKGKADPHSALLEYRRQKARPDLVRNNGPAPWEPINPHGKRELRISEDELARRRKEREEIAELMHAALEADNAQPKASQ